MVAETLPSEVRRVGDVSPVTSPAAAPLGQAGRIDTLDSLRGFALLGILLMNIVGFGLPHAYSDPTVSGGATGADLAVWAVMNMGFEGAMRTIFSLLFGAGVVLLTSRLESGENAPDVADIYYRRTIWLIVFGVIHAYFLLWVGEILYYYGLAGLFLYPFRKASPRLLIIAGVIVLASLVPRYVFWHYDAMSMKTEARAAQAVKDVGGKLTEAQEKAIGAWDEKVKGMKPPPEKLAEHVAGMRGGYVKVFLTLAPEVVMLQSIVTYQLLFWDALGVMLIGMGLHKLGVLTGERSLRFYALAAVAGYAVGLGVNWHETRLLLAQHFDVLARLETDTTYEVGRLGLAIGHTSTLLMVMKAGLLRRTMARLAAVGQMALTNYISQTIICILLFDGFGFGLFGALRRHQLYYVVLGIWIVQLAWSPIWLRYFRFGPLEWVWRSLTYWRRQPFRRVAIASS